MWGCSGDAGLDREDFRDAWENNLVRLFFFLSVFSIATPSSSKGSGGSPDPPSAKVIVELAPLASVW